MESGSPQSSHYCLSFTTELMQRVIMRLGSSLKAEFNSESAGNVLQPWVRSGQWFILSVCVQEEAIVPKIASLLYHPRLHCFPISLGGRIFSPYFFKMLLSNITVSFIFMTMRVFLLKLFIPMTPHFLFLRYVWSLMQRCNSQGCRNGAESLSIHVGTENESRRIISPRGSNSGQLCNLGQVTWPPWTLLTPFLEKGGSRCISKFSS